MGETEEGAKELFTKNGLKNTKLCRWLHTTVQPKSEGNVCLRRERGGKGAFLESVMPQQV